MSVICKQPAPESFPLCSPTSKDLCYHLLPHKLDFTTAERECRLFNQSLVTITNHKELGEIQTLIKSNNLSVEEVWIGLSDKTHRRAYGWTSGYQALPQLFWASEEPSNKNGSGSCVAMTISDDPIHSWHTYSCLTEHFPICGPIPSQLPTDSGKYKEGICPVNFQRIMNYCIYFHGATDQELASQNEARLKCKHINKDADLATVHSFEEQNYFTAYLADFKTGSWIGLQLNTTSAEHYWIRNDTITFTNWKRNEPSGKKDEPCVFMYNRLKNIGEWNDDNCTKKAGFICEVGLQPSDSGPPKKEDLFNIFKQGRCGDGFYEFHDACYQHMESKSNKLYTYAEANTVCASLNTGKSPAHVVIPYSNYEAAFVRALVSHSVYLTLPSDTVRDSSFWLGASIIFSDSSFRTNYSDPAAYDQYFHFFEKMPTTSTVEQDKNFCYLSSYKWDKNHLVNCSKQSRGVCRYYLESNALYPREIKLKCKNDTWHQLGHSCYLASTFAANFAESEAFCSQSADSGHLASIHSANELNSIIKLVESSRTQTFLQNRDLWVGLRRTDSHSMQGKKFEWTDGTPYDFMHFRVGEPSITDRYGNPEDCIVLRAQTREMNDYDCVRTNNFICKAPAAEDISVPCEGSPFQFNLGDKCYGYLHDATNWEQAAQQCVVMGGTLLYLRNKTEETLLQEKIFKQIPHGISVWMGVHIPVNSFGTILFSTSGEFAEYFGNSVKSDNVGATSCLVWSSGNEGDNKPTWKLVNCSEKYKFMCEKFVESYKPSDRRAYPPYHPRELPSNLTCSRGYAMYRDKCYKVMQSKSTYEGAKASCFEGGHGQLAGSDSLESNLFLSSLLENNTELVLWSENLSPFGQSLMKDKKFCSAIYNSGWPNTHGKWVWQKCTEQASFICEKNALPNKQTNALNDEKDCPSGAVYFRRESCYWLPRDYPSNLDLSRQSCTENDATLLTLDSVYEANFLLSWLFTHTSASSPVDVWLDLRINKSSPLPWFWNDSSPLRFTTFFTPTESWGKSDISCFRWLVSSPKIGTVVDYESPYMYRVDCNNHETGMAVCKKRMKPIGKSSCQNYYKNLKMQIGSDLKETFPMFRVPNINPFNSVSMDGKQCLRWDSVWKRENITNLFLPTSLLLNGNGYASFAENYCSSVWRWNPMNRLLGSAVNEPYGCYTSLGVFTKCELTKCSADDGRSELLTSFAILFSIAAAGGVVLLLYAWFNKAWCFGRALNYGLVPRYRLSSLGEETLVVENDVPQGSGLALGNDFSTAFHNPVYQPCSTEAADTVT